MGSGSSNPKKATKSEVPLKSCTRSDSQKVNTSDREKNINLNDGNSKFDSIDGLPNPLLQENCRKTSKDANTDFNRAEANDFKQDKEQCDTTGTRTGSDVLNAEKLQKDEEERRQKENLEAERKRINTLKSSLQEKLQRLKNKYQAAEIQFNSVEVAVLKMKSLQSKQSNTNQKLYSLDENRYKEVRIKIAKHQQERVRLLHRLSEIASARLRQNNPDIADLSDPNRATKLAEKLSELYDNEWTDVFEATKKKAGGDDKVIAKGLRDILESCYEKCDEIANSQQRFWFCMLNLNVTTDFQTAPPDFRLRLKDFQKNVSQYSLPHVKQVTREDAKERLKNNVVVKHFHSVKKKNTYKPYIDLCTEITWYMQIQDPPLVLDFDESTSDVTKFRPYTVSGPHLDYIIWPAMLLHKGGPTVAKGVAQFKKQSDKSEQRSEGKKEKQNNINEKGVITAPSVW